MRPALTVLAALLLSSSARATDLTGVLTDYLLNKVPPTLEDTKTQGLQQRMWINPKGLAASKLLFVFTYGVSQDHWALVLNDYHLPRSTYFGTDKFTYLGKLNSGSSIYRLGGGRFKGFFVEQGTQKGIRLLSLVTPQFAALSPEMSRLIK
ncbi:hypothetical protein [Deinococcus sp.]|uniref:hypothetical protein n=1 Tax=Deinococcus sp. TaxID=47478 RepID=UPI003CC566D6